MNIAGNAAQIRPDNSAKPIARQRQPDMSATRGAARLNRTRFTTRASMVTITRMSQGISSLWSTSSHRIVPASTATSTVPSSDRGCCE